MKIKSTFLILFISIWVNQFYGQFTPQKPDLRNCGSAPNYYTDYFNCTSNNYTLDDVFLSISNSSGVPITTPCAPPNVQNVFLWLNYTSNSSSSIHQTRIFADILVKDQNGNLIQTLQINSYLGEVASGAGQRLLVIPGYPTGFPWTCGYELSLTKLLVVWKTNGNSSDPELATYNCGTYNKSQCELPTSMIVSAPMAVQFEYTQCTISNTTTVNFDDDTNGGDPPYTYLWNFGDSTTSTLQNPSHTFPYPGGPYTVTLQVTDSGSPQQVSASTQIINLINPINITGNVTSSPCSSGNVGAIDVSVSGGTPGYTYLWSNGATTQDLTGLANGSYTVTVTDSVGCTAQQIFIITGGDTSPPVVTAPANLTLQGCNTTILGLSGYFPFSSTISIITQAQFILVGGTISDASAISSVTYIDTVLGTCPRVVSRLFTIADACNNSTQVTQTFTIQDTTAPNITTPVVSQIVECNGSGNLAQLNAWLAANGGASASDVCSGVTWSNNYSGSLSDLCGLTGSATVTFTATDACGNASTSSGTFTIQDTTDPTISTQASDMIVECDGAGNLAQLNAWLAANGGASASDVCSGVTWSNNYSGSLSDLCGLTGSATVIFT
ncbi:PKD domain-containing protein, partial [Flavobacterium terrigena]